MSHFGYYVLKQDGKTEVLFDRHLGMDEDMIRDLLSGEDFVTNQIAEIRQTCQIVESLDEIDEYGTPIIYIDYDKKTLVYEGMCSVLSLVLQEAFLKLVQGVWQGWDVQCGVEFSREADEDQDEEQEYDSEPYDQHIQKNCQKSAFAALIAFMYFAGGKKPFTDKDIQKIFAAAIAAIEPETNSEPFSNQSAEHGRPILQSMSESKSTSPFDESKVWQFLCAPLNFIQNLWCDKRQPVESTIEFSLPKAQSMSISAPQPVVHILKRKIIPENNPKAQKRQMEDLRIQLEIGLVDSDLSQSPTEMESFFEKNHISPEDAKKIKHRYRSLGEVSKMCEIARLSLSKQYR